MKSVTIAGLARTADVGVETVRYYQRRGLLDVPAGDGIRRYDEEDVRRLHFIRSAQGAGFTLEEIGELLALDRRKDRSRIHELAASRVAALDVKIATLAQARDALVRLATSCASGTKGPCPIIEAFDPAG